MFDFGFSKLLLIGIVALVVIGPERLPRVARTLGALYGRLQRYVTQVKADINREIDVAELGKVKTEFENAARSFQSDVEAKVSDAEREIREAHASLERAIDTSAQAANEASAPAAPEASPQLELGIEEPAPLGAPRDKAAG
ncbi:MAG TPA: Sec-independent protein translocase protein TatB [Usitatibacter sp.]